MGLLRDSVRRSKDVRPAIRHLLPHLLTQFY
jgi:hypothetical protein